MCIESVFGKSKAESKIYALFHTIVIENIYFVSLKTDFKFFPVYLIEKENSNNSWIKRKKEINIICSFQKNFHSNFQISGIEPRLD